MGTVAVRRKIIARDDSELRLEERVDLVSGRVPRRRAELLISPPDTLSQKPHRRGGMSWVTDITSDF